MVYRVPALETVEFAANKPKAVLDAARQVLAAMNGIALLVPKGVVWRGQADAHWRLESKASRLGFSATDVAVHEQAMLMKARELGVEGAQHLGDWEILARLRHHGATTRLIDCTS